MKTPEEIKLLLDESVIGQEQAKKHLAVAGYNQLKRINGYKIKKTNALIVGPSGSGKTHLVSTLASILNIPYIIVDCTQLTASGYEGRSVEDFITDLVSSCSGDLQLAQNAIIYLDEVDKIKRKNTSNDVNGLGVQQALLKMIEGCEVSFTSPHSPIEYDSKLNTRNILFIASGAFVDLKDLSSSSLIKFGMIPEFVGRFSIFVKLEELTIDQLCMVLTDSKESILHSYDEWFSSENIEFFFEEDAIRYLAEKAKEEGLGARGLHRELQELLLETQFKIPSLKDKPTEFILNLDLLNSFKK